MMEDTNADDGTRILFMDTIPSENEKLRGGAVLTDIRTEPIEFRCTDTVSPNRLQRTLWGKRLRGHLTVEWHCRGRKWCYALALPDSSCFFRTWRGCCMSLSLWRRRLRTRGSMRPGRSPTSQVAIWDSSARQ